MEIIIHDWGADYERIKTIRAKKKNLQLWDHAYESCISCYLGWNAVLEIWLVGRLEKWEGEKNQLVCEK